MRTIGIIGGMSWESSQLYYQIINTAVRERLGGLHSADCLMYSFDFHEIEALQHIGDWDAAAQRMVDAAQRLKRGGAACIVIATNTMHKLAPQVAEAVDIPLLHIADATAIAVQAAGIQRVALLGTRYTMEQDFYKGRLIDRYGLDVLIPNEADREIIHRAIYDELCLGVIHEDSRAAYIRIITDLAAQGAQAVILGCTEITLLIQPEHSPIPTFDTTRLHALAAVDFALTPQPVGR
ncbi:MAG: aspartate/glutamate racemase family protein [Phototrophicaceae bacterium]|jgi:aspartate racemase